VLIHISVRTWNIDYMWIANCTFQRKGVHVCITITLWTYTGTYRQNSKHFSPTYQTETSGPILTLGRFTYLLTYSLTPWSRVLLEKVTGSHLAKIFPAKCGEYLSLSWPTSIQSMPPHPTSWRSYRISRTFPLLMSCRRISPGPTQLFRFRNYACF